jgi:methylmalonyl-CoA mutase N-terminal domain/subunit
MSLNTQHIVSDETGVTDVTDPLAGSYFVEYLTNKVEEEACKILKEIESGERLIVGVNELIIPPEEDDDIPIQSLDASDSEEIAKRMESWKKTRNLTLLKEKIEKLYNDAKKRSNYNLMPSIIEAVKAYGTAGEIMGVIRMANGTHYDPLEMIDCPFDL